MRTPRRRASSAYTHVEQIVTVVAENVSVLPELDSGYYRAGVDACRRAHTALADAPGVVDDVEHHIESLLQRTLDLLGDESAP